MVFLALIRCEGPSSNQHAGGYYEDLLVEIRTDESFQYFHTVMGNGRAGRDNGEAETM